MRNIFRFACIICFAFIFPLELLAQESTMKGAHFCATKKQKNPHPLILANNSPNAPRHAYDVLDYKLNLDIYNCFVTPYPKSFAASEIITFRVDTALNSIALDAINTSMTIDSVRIAGASFTHSANILTVTLNRVYNPGEVVQVKISYRHNNVADQAFYTYQGMVFTDCEPEGARKWFPCWDKPSDKATLDLTAKMPRTVKFGSNGRLADSTQVADTIWHRWVSRDPISTYLIVMTGKVNYNLDIVYWRPPTHPADSIPMRFYYNSGENVTSAKATIIPMTTRYSELFGEHPFEKNGFATIASGAGFVWGGMENQTLTSFCANCWGDNLMSHEFAHQWFGDMITCGTWADIWLNEGFATYTEALWYEYTGGYTQYKNDILSDASSYLGSNPGRPIYNPPMSDLFNYAMTYAKGACVLHMLRYTLGDSLFFRLIKSYATDTTDYKYKSSITTDFMAKVNSVTGQNLDWFFNEWIFTANHPVYANTYNITSLGSGNWQVGFRATQTQTNTGFFTMPLEIKMSFATGPDTTVRVMNTFNSQSFAFRFNRQPTAVQFDPNNNIVLKSASITVGPTLAAPTPLFPVNGGIKQATTLRVTWLQAVSAATYRLQLAADSLFTSTIVDDSTVTDTSRQVGLLQGSTRYYWRVNGKNSAGTSAWSAKWSFTTSAVNEVAEGIERPHDFFLGQNYPNPFNPSTVITFGLPASGHVTVSVYNTLGERVALLANREMDSGYHHVTFENPGLSSGVSFYRLEAAGFVQSRKLLLMK